MGLETYEITGITEENISNWLENGDTLRDDITIFKTSRRGSRKIKILINLTKCEYLKIKFQLFIFNLKHHTKIQIKSQA